MAEEKKYSAREAAIAVLKKTEELLKNSALMKSDKDKSVTQQMLSDDTQKKLTQGFPDKAPSAKMTAFMQGKKKSLAKSEDPAGEIHPKEEVQGEPTNPGKRVEEQAAPDKNPKEQAEGNNMPAGTTPTQVGQDGKNVPGFDEMHSALKLAKFIGHMESKRKARKAPGVQ